MASPALTDPAIISRSIAVPPGAAGVAFPALPAGTVVDAHARVVSRIHATSITLRTGVDLGLPGAVLIRIAADAVTPQ